MGDVVPAPRDASPVSTADDRLDSWKGIAAYLKRDVSTVQRWEKKEGLPVHRLPHDKLGSVFAFRPELDAWWNRGRQRIEAAESTAGLRSGKSLVSIPALLRATLRAGVIALRKSWRRVLTLTVLLLGAFVAGGVVMSRIVPSRSSGLSTVRMAHLAIPLPAGTSLAVEGDTDPAIAISRDGTTIAYVVRRGPITQIYIRRLDGREAKPVPGTEGARSPFFSPDGQSLGFIGRSRLSKVALATGEVVVLCSGVSASMRGAAWGRDDTIVFARDLDTELWRVSAAGGPCTNLTNRENAEHSHRLPAFLPDGDGFLFTVGMPRMESWNDARTHFSRLTTGERRHVLEGGTTPRYSTTGHLLYSKQGSLFAVPFDPGRAQVVGRPVEVLNRLVMSPTGGEAHYAVSETGVLAYAAGVTWGSQDRIVWVDREGDITPLSEQRDSFGTVRLSPDGRYLAVETDRLRIDLWVYDLTRGTMTRLTSEGIFNDWAVWTPDGRRLTYRSDLGSPGSGTPGLRLVWRAADGGSAPELFKVGEEAAGEGVAPSSWSPDGEILAFSGFTPRGGLDIWILRRSTMKIEPLLAGPFNEAEPVFSPDGRWLAYVSNESGRPEIYVRPFPSLDGRSQISSGGGRLPRWARDTGELFYREGEKLMAVDVKTSRDFSAGRPRMLFENAALGGNFDVAADGRRFVMIDHSSNPRPTQIEVIVNWFDELKRKVPGPR